MRLIFRSRFPHKYSRSITSVRIPGLLERLSIPECRYNHGKNVLLNIAGPSGVGKGTLGLKLERKGIQRFVRTTSRPRRTTERNGVDYIFLNEKQFKKMQTNNAFLSAFATYGEWRGIDHKTFWQLIRNNKLFYIDGCAQTSKDIFKALSAKGLPYLSLFILPPSFQELVARLLSRTSGEKEKDILNRQILRRIRSALQHLRESGLKYRDTNLIHGYILNDSVDRAVWSILQII